MRATPRDSEATAAGTTLSIVAPASESELAARMVVCASPRGTVAVGIHRLSPSAAEMSAVNVTPCRSSRSLIRPRARDSRDSTVPRAQPSRCRRGLCAQAFEVMQHNRGRGTVREADPPRRSAVRSLVRVLRESTLFDRPRSSSAPRPVAGGADDAAPPRRVLSPQPVGRFRTASRPPTPASGSRLALLTRTRNVA